MARLRAYDVITRRWYDPGSPPSHLLETGVPVIVRFDALDTAISDGSPMKFDTNNQGVYIDGTEVCKFTQNMQIVGVAFFVQTGTTIQDLPTYTGTTCFDLEVDSVVTNSFGASAGSASQVTFTSRVDVAAGKTIGVAWNNGDGVTTDGTSANTIVEVYCVPVPLR